MDRRLGGGGKIRRGSGAVGVCGCGARFPAFGGTTGKRRSRPPRERTGVEDGGEWAEEWVGMGNGRWAGWPIAASWPASSPKLYSFCFIIFFVEKGQERNRRV